MGTADAGLLRHWVVYWGGLKPQLVLWTNRSMLADWVGLARLSPRSAATGALPPFLVLQMTMVTILVALPEIASTPPLAATLTDKQVEEALKAPPELTPELPTDPIPTK